MHLILQLHLFKVSAIFRVTEFNLKYGDGTCTCHTAFKPYIIHQYNEFREAKL